MRFEVKHSTLKSNNLIGINDPVICAAAAFARIDGRRARARLRGERCECIYWADGVFARCQYCAASGIRYLPRYVPGALQCISFRHTSGKWYRCDRPDGHTSFHAWGSIPMRWSIGDKPVRVVCDACKADVTTARYGDDDPPWYTRCPTCNADAASKQCKMIYLSEPAIVQPFAGSSVLDEEP